MKKVRIGVLGGFRGNSMIQYCKRADNAEIVAICDNNPFVLGKQRELSEGLNIALYDNFDEFIRHDMDAVVLANFANEHAPFAIRAMNAGKHVYSEVLPVQTISQAVALIEAVEKTGMIYHYGENYCYMPAPYEMRRLYRDGKIGEFEYGECEYVHNCESIVTSTTYGEKNHWRNRVIPTFYCTHSIGPIVHATGLRPVSVIGFEGCHKERNLRSGYLGGNFAMELLTLENGAVVKSLHGGLYNNSIWYAMYGGKGSMESARERALIGDIAQTIYVKADEFSGEYAERPVENYYPTRPLDDMAAGFGHGNSDFYCMYNFVEKILGNPDADTIDVYEGLDMSLPGLFAFRSILDGNVRKEIPDLRDKAEREKWRNDNACTDPAIAGDQVLPVSSTGPDDIDDSVYDAIKKRWEEQLAQGGDSRVKGLLGTK